MTALLVQSSEGVTSMLQKAVTHPGVSEVPTAAHALELFIGCSVTNLYLSGVKTSGSGIAQTPASSLAATKEDRQRATSHSRGW